MKRQPVVEVVMSAALVFLLAVGAGLSKLLHPVTETAVIPAKA
jgi:hypothetical protein